VARLDEEIDRLYSLPLDEFTRERNATATRLRKEGEKEAADELKALTKPTAAAWAINQAARRHPAKVKALLAAGQAVRKAQLGGKGAEAVAEAGRRERDAVSELADAARAILEDETGRATRQTLDKIGATLHATTVDADARRLLEERRLSEDLEPTGFGPLLAAVPGKAAARAPAKRGEDKRKRLQQAREALKQARAEERELAAAAREAEREAGRAQERAQEATEAAEAAAERVADAEREVEKLR
jgi:hypothetical protein